jgi:hypothetical protein
VQVHVNIHPLVTRPSPYSKAPTHLSTPEMLRVRECIPTISPSSIFTFGFVVEFVKEFGGASHIITLIFVRKKNQAIYRFNFSMALYEKNTILNHSQ